MFVVGQWLHHKGYSVEIPAFEIAPSIAEYADYQDNGDVFVFVYWHYDVRHRYEIRHLPDTHFTSRANWPYGDRIFVDKKEKVDTARHEVLAWVTVSDDYRTIAVIPRNTNDQWYLTKVNNTKRGRIEDTYAAPLSCADFERLDPWWL